MSAIKTSFAILTLMLLTIVGFEYFFRIVFLVRDNASDQVAISVSDERAVLPAYQDSDYDPNDLWEEIWAATNIWLSYEPYTVWRHKPFHGTFVNVGEDGFRATTDNSTDANALTIWVFGGSTTWGMAVPDAETIPSNLSRLFNDAGLATVVHNFGETGFVSTQDLLALVRALQIQKAPDLVIFYEGVNEPLGLAERPDLVNPHYLMGRITDLFAGVINETHPLIRLFQKSAMQRLARTIARRLGNKESGPDKVAYPTELDEIPSLVLVAAKAYEHNLLIISALADEFDIVPYFFLQPSLGVGTKPLDPSEAEILSGLTKMPDQDWMIRFSTEFRAQIVERFSEGGHGLKFFDITDVFSTTSDAVFVDWVHVSHKGNVRIANNIFSIIRNDICESQEKQLFRRINDFREALCPGQI